MVDNGARSALRTFYGYVDDHVGDLTPGEAHRRASDTTGGAEAQDNIRGLRRYEVLRNRKTR